MGSDQQLRNFTMTLDITNPRAPKLIFTRKDTAISEILVDETEEHDSNLLL